MVHQQRFVAPQQPQQSTALPAAVAGGYQYYTPVYSQYPSVAVPPPSATWLQQAATATSGTIPNHYVIPQQLQPAVCGV